MPAGRAARPRPPPPPPLPSRLGSHVGPGGDRAGRPFPHPGRAECVAAPAGGYFEREGSGPASVFSAFSWPPAHQPGPSAARGVGGGGHVAGRRAVRVGGPRRPGSGPGPGGARRRCGPLLSARARAAGLLIAPGPDSSSGAPATCAPLLRGAPPGRALPPQ